MTYCFVCLASLMFTLTAWLSKLVYDMGLPDGQLRGGRLLAASFGGVLVLALIGWLDRAPPLVLPTIPQAEASFVSHQDSRMFHLPNCPHAVGADPMKPCRHCLEELRGYEAAAKGAERKEDGDETDSSQHIQHTSLVHERPPVE